jgi:hypothetical protein
MNCSLPAPLAIFFQFNLTLHQLFVFGRPIVSSFAVGAS